MDEQTTLQWYAAAPRPGYDVYELWNTRQQLATLEVNQFSQTAKISSQDNRRLFKLEKEGFLRNKLVLKNEYGIKIGQVGSELWDNHEGSIDLNGEHFYYGIDEASLSQLVIYKKDRRQPLLSCGLVSNNGTSILNKSYDRYSCLLMALCWFLFLPVAQQHLGSVLAKS